MGFLLPLLVLSLRQGDGPSRFARLMKDTPSYSVKFTATAPGLGTSIVGSLSVKKPSSLRYDVTIDGSTVHLIKSGLEATEIADQLKMYQVHHDEPGLNLFETVMVEDQMGAMPWSLLLGSLAREKPPASKFTLTETSGGVETYKVSYTERSVTNDLEVDIDAAGHLLGMRRSSKGPTGEQHISWKFSDFQASPTFSSATFSTVPPRGYASALISKPVDPIMTESRVKLGTWNSPKGRVDLQKAISGKLLIVVDPSAYVDGVFLAYLKEHRFGVPVIVAALTGKGGDVYNPPASVARKLSSSGTPAMFKIAPSGEVRRMWLGFNESDFSKTIAEIKEAFRGGK